MKEGVKWIRSQASSLRMKSPVLNQRSPIEVILFVVNFVKGIVAKSHKQGKGWQHVLTWGIWFTRDLMLLDYTLSVEFCPNYTNQRVILHAGIS